MSIRNEQKHPSPLGGGGEGLEGTFKGIIFDLDGTLIDSIADIKKFSNQVLKKYGFPTHPLDKYIEWVGNGARKLIEKAVPNGLDNTTFEQLFQDYLYYYEHYEHTESRLYDGVPELLRQLSEKRIPIAILTNKPHAVTLKTVETYFKPWQFVKVEGQQEGKVRKPDPTEALNIAELMQLKPQEIAFIGDSAVDVKTGKAAGMTTICINAGYETLDNILNAQPDVVVENHKELLTVLKNI